MPAAASIGRDVADAADRRVLVAGSMGPTGELIAPLGELTTDESWVAFAEQAAGLADGVADILWLETMSAPAEVEAGVLGARSASDLPIVVTLSFDTAGRTMMGITGEDAGARLAELGVAGIGANCGANLADTEAAVAAIRSVCGDIPVVSKANAGIPVWKGCRARVRRHPGDPRRPCPPAPEGGHLHHRGLLWSNPSHIAMIRAVLDGDQPVPDIAPPVATATVGAAERQERRRRRRRS